MDRHKFKCKYCQSTRLKKTNAGTYACGECGREPDSIMPSSMLVSEVYVKSAANVRSKGHIVQRTAVEKQAEITDLEYHLEEKWVNYLQYFQEALKFNITQLQQKLGLDPRVNEITKKVWLKYLDKWSQSKKRIVGFFSVPRKGLYTNADPTYPKRKYQFPLDQLEEVSGLEDEDEEEREEQQQTSTFNFDLIFSQMTQASTQQTATNKEDPKDDKKLAELEALMESRKEFYSTKYWLKPQEPEKEKIKKKRRKASEHADITEVKVKEKIRPLKKKSGLAKDLFSKNPVEFLKNIHNYYAKISSNTISQIIEDYNQILNFQKGDSKERIKSIKRRSSYLKVDSLQTLLKERKIEPENLKLCFSRQGFQKMAKDMIFVHDYFCFVIYRHQELEPIPFDTITKYIKEVTEREDLQEDEEETEASERAKKKKEEALIKLAKQYISKHLAEEEEAMKPERKKTPKLFPLEFNLIPLICFVALRLANYPVFPRDIVQWIKYQTLPFFTAHLHISFEGLKEYLIKPLNIPSSSWIRSSYNKFLKVYEIECPTTQAFANSLMERIFLDCEIPHTVLQPCIRLYEFINIIRKDYKYKPIDEDLVILSVVLGTLKLFYGFDDNFYGVFLKMEKIEEAYEILRDEGLRLDLLNMINTFSKYADKSSAMKCFTNLPKFDNVVQKWQQKISNGNFNTFFPVEGVPLPWEYKDLKNISKDNVIEFLESTKRTIYSEENQSEFSRLQSYFEGITLGDRDEVDMNSERSVKTRVEVADDLFLRNKNCTRKLGVSKFFTEEIKFASKYLNKENMETEDGEEEEIVDLPLPCDNYFIYKKFNSIPLEKIKHEFLFLLNLFSVFLNEPVEDVQKGLKFVDKHLIRLVALLEE